MTDAGFTGTPGPWALVAWSGAPSDLVVEAYPGGTLKMIGRVYGALGFDDDKANAALIAAAPDLYEALDLLVTRLTNEAGDWVCGAAAIEAARAALSKATVKPGGAPQADPSVPPQTSHITEAK